MAPLESKTYVCDPRPRYPFRIVAKRYTCPKNQVRDDDPNALTLIFAHATGYLKEIWEPTIEYLFDYLESGQGDVGPVKVLDVWSFDAPNHGDAAALNENVLTWGYTPLFSWEEYSRSIHAFLTGLGTGVDVDFSKRRLVGVGHSMGGASIMLADTFMPTLKFESILLVDPMLYRKPRPGELLIGLAALSSKRRDIWASHDEADKFFKSRPAFRPWDPRVLDIYIKYGLRDLPTAEYPDKQGVTLKCHKDYEVACYTETHGKARSYNYLYDLCTRVPVHFIYGAITDYLPKDFQDDVLDVAARGQYASLTRVPEAGHLLPLTKPKSVAEAMVAALRLDVARGFAPGPAGNTQARL